MLPNWPIARFTLEAALIASASFINKLYVLVAYRMSPGNLLACRELLAKAVGLALHSILVPLQGGRSLIDWSNGTYYCFPAGSL